LLPLRERLPRLHCRNAKSIFSEAERRELFRKNPFGILKSSAIAAQRTTFVTPEAATNILKACPSVDWQVLFGLARFSGLRIPSESHILTWENVDWERKRLHVYAPKTDSIRVVPIVTQLFEILEKARALASSKTDKIVQMSANNLHRNFKQLLPVAGIDVWDDLFQTLRRSCETDLAKHCPQGAVSRWIGHSMRVSGDHYLWDDDSVMDAATRLDFRGENAESDGKKRAVESAAEESRIVAQVEETRGNAGRVIGGKTKNPLYNRGFFWSGWGRD
jgi:integrase